jgi:hypothetical protein
MRPPRCVPIMKCMSERGLHHIEDELGENWLDGWLERGLEKLEAYLANHAAFLAYLDAAEPHS